MQPTRIGLLIRMGGIALGVSFVFFFWLLQTFDFLLPLSGTVAIALFLLDIALAIWAFQIRDRLPKSSLDAAGEVILLRAKNPLGSLVAARSAALGLAATRTGAVLAGSYGAVGLIGILRWEVVAARELFFIAIATALAAVLLGWLGLWIERICRLPDPRP